MPSMNRCKNLELVVLPNNDGVTTPSESVRVAYITVSQLSRSASPSSFADLSVKRVMMLGHNQALESYKSWLPASLWKKAYNIRG